ncbi:MAG: carboxypeptidase regulatory-like domain-containing protein [Bacteroidia bacterium]
MNTTKLLFISMLISFSGIAQDWKLVFSSRVEKNDKGFGGATINLLSSSGAVVQQATSDASGFFKLDVPANGDYNLVVTKDGHVSKTIHISTTGVPADKNKDNFKQGLNIESISLFEPLQGVNYSGLNQPVLHIKYQSGTGEFSDDEAYTTKMQTVLQNIRSQEKQIMDQYDAAVKGGDDAFKKKNWAAAKDAYEKALGILTNKDYPKERLAKLEQAKKADEEAKKAAAEKAEAERLAKEKAAAEKAEKEKAAAEKAEAERLAKEKIAAEKAEADRIAMEKTNAEKTEKEKAASEKTEAERLAKEKSAAEKAEADRIAMEKANAEKTLKEAAVTKKTEEKPVTVEKQNGEKTSFQPSSAEPVSMEARGRKSDARHSIAPLLGADKYKDALNKAEGYYKMKRYSEAKVAYENVLKIKPEDMYCKSKLANIERLSVK